MLFFSRSKLFAVLPLHLFKQGWLWWWWWRYAEVGLRHLYQSFSMSACRNSFFFNVDFYLLQNISSIFDKLYFFFREMGFVQKIWWCSSRSRSLSWYVEWMAWGLIFHLSFPLFQFHFKKYRSTTYETKRKSSDDAFEMKTLLHILLSFFSLCIWGRQAWNRKKREGGRR